MPPQPPPMVSMPASVLMHIDSVVSDMKKELSAIHATEQRQDVFEFQQAQLNEIQRVMAENLRSKEDEMHAEVSRLSHLEADHLNLADKCVAELEQQRSIANNERKELTRIRAALEVE